MLRHGLQYNSYCWKNVTYQGKPCSEYIHKYPSHQTQTPNDKFLFKTGLEVPIAKDCPESVLHYSSEYITESASFFNSFRFWHHCKMFNIDVRLVQLCANNDSISDCQGNTFIRPFERLCCNVILLYKAQYTVF